MEKNMEILVLDIKLYNIDRYNQIKNNTFFQEEVDLINKDSKNISYYKHIINNIELNRDNIQNSYIMWIYDKVDIIDINKSTIFEGSRFEYPDIDCDFPPSDRERILDYIRNKYGNERVCQVVTFGRMMGASILTEVLSAHSAVSFEQIKELTKVIPNEAEVADQLEATHTDSVIQLVLEHYPDKLSDYCTYKDGKYIGEYARYFEQAIRLEGTFKNQGKHAAGLVIAPETTHENCPMIYDKNTDHKIAGLDMDALKKVGFIKFDILGVRALEEIKNIFETVGERYAK